MSEVKTATSKTGRGDPRAHDEAIAAILSAIRELMDPKKRYPLD